MSLVCDGKLSPNAARDAMAMPADSLSQMIGLLRASYQPTIPLKDWMGR
jgi:hypothetical protein